jgi:hypothetical protein
MATPFIMVKCFYVFSTKMVTLISHLFMPSLGVKLQTLAGSGLQSEPLIWFISGIFYLAK